MHIFKATFFTEMGATDTIAVVVVQTDHDGTHASIGTSQQQDSAAIGNKVAEHGARFPLAAAAKLLNSIPLIEL
jgi:hypothetical protein